MCIYLYIINILSTHTYITAYIMYTKTFILDVINHYSALKLGPCDLRDAENVDGIAESTQKTEFTV